MNIVIEIVYDNKQWVFWCWCFNLLRNYFYVYRFDNVSLFGF